MLGHVERDALVDGGIVRDAVARADDQRGTGERPPREPDARLDRGAIRAGQRGGIADASKCPPGRAGKHRCNRCETWRDVEIDETILELGDG